MNRQSAFAVALAASATAVLGFAAAPASAITLTDQNSSAFFDLTSQRGLYNWIVKDAQGQDHDVLALGDDNITGEWFWYRIGNNAEQSIDTLFLSSSQASDSNGDGKDDILTATYSHDLFDLDIKWSLQGGTPGSGFSDIGEQIRITNKSGNPLPISFFEYTDFDLNRTPGGDTVEFTPVIPQIPSFQAFEQKDPDELAGITEISLEAPPARAEAALYDATLQKLNDGVASDLNNNRGPLSGDVTASWQWNFNIAAGDIAQISKDKQVVVKPVPEPASVGGLLAIGSIGIGAILKRQRQQKNKLDS